MVNLHKHQRRKTRATCWVVSSSLMKESFSRVRRLALPKKQWRSSLEESAAAILQWVSSWAELTATRAPSMSCLSSWLSQSQMRVSSSSASLRSWLRSKSMRIFSLSWLKSAKTCNISQSETWTELLSRSERPWFKWACRSWVTRGSHLQVSGSADLVARRRAISCWKLSAQATFQL